MTRSIDLALGCMSTLWEKGKKGPGRIHAYGVKSMGSV